MTRSQIALIREAARRAAIARVRGDEATARFEKRWATQAIHLESDPKIAEEAYRIAYRQAAQQYRGHV